MKHILRILAGGAWYWAFLILTDYDTTKALCISLLFGLGMALYSLAEKD